MEAVSDAGAEGDAVLGTASPPAVDGLETFSRWLEQLPSDVTALCDTLVRAETPDALRRASADIVSHLHRSLELIPEGLEALGYVDHAFVARALARDAVSSHAEADAEAAAPELSRLASEADLVIDFLGADFGSFLEGVRRAHAAPAWRESADALLEDEERRASVLEEVRAWVRDYSAPALGRGEEGLLVLQSFMRTRVGRFRASGEVLEPGAGAG